MAEYSSFNSFPYCVDTSQLDSFECEQFGTGSDVIQCVLKDELPKPSYTFRIIHNVNYALTLSYSSKMVFQLRTTDFKRDVGVWCDGSLSLVNIRSKKKTHTLSLMINTRVNMVLKELTKDHEILRQCTSACLLY